MDFNQDGILNSDCGKYTFAKWAHIAEGSRGPFMVICMSPTPGEDQTFAICRSYAERLGYSSVVLVYLYALRGFNPAGISAEGDAVHPANDQVIANIAREAGIIVGAWGDAPFIKKRIYAILDLLRGHDIFSIQNNSRGTPTHPLAWRQKSPKLYRKAASTVKDAS